MSLGVHACAPRSVLSKFCVERSTLARFGGAPLLRWSIVRALAFALLAGALLGIHRHVLLKRPSARPENALLRPRGRVWAAPVGRNSGTVRGLFHTLYFADPITPPKAAQLASIPPQCGFHPSRFSAAEFANAPLELAGAYLGPLTRGL
jgi:hypothetical protein